MGRKSTRIYVIRPDGGKAVVFLAHPDTPGLWIRTDVSVLIAACSMCHAAVGEPCRGRAGKPGEPHGWTHYHRRDAARRAEVPAPNAALAIVLASKGDLSGSHAEDEDE
jgi:hypothetical protein